MSVLTPSNHSAIVNRTLKYIVYFSLLVFSNKSRNPVYMHLQTWEVTAYDTCHNLILQYYTTALQ